jgi:hypothetical protein
VAKRKKFISHHEGHEATRSIILFFFVILLFGACPRESGGGGIVRGFKSKTSVTVFLPRSSRSDTKYYNILFFKLYKFLFVVLQFGACPRESGGGGIVFSGNGVCSL